MSPEENKALVHHVFEQCWNQGNLDAGDGLIADTCKLHYQGAAIPAGGEAGIRIVRTWRAAFRDFRFTFEDWVAEGDRVAVRMSFEGTHQGQFWGIAPTGKRIHATEMLFVRIQDGKIAEMWEDFDQLGVLRQLGALPESS